METLGKTTGVMKERKIPMNKIKKDRPESLAQLKKKVQVQFNAWIRHRDRGLPCISCGQTKEHLQAGHLFPVKKYDGLRFHEHNVNGECPACNSWDESHVIWYRYNLIEKIGVEKYNELERLAMEYRNGGTGPTLKRDQLNYLLNKYTRLNQENRSKEAS